MNAYSYIMSRMKILSSYRNKTTNPAVTPNIPISFFVVNSSLKKNADMTVNKEIEAALAAFTKPTFGAS